MIVGYEFRHRPDLPPLPLMLHLLDDGVYWDAPPNAPKVKVDFDELVRLGYCVPIEEAWP